MSIILFMVDQVSLFDSVCRKEIYKVKALCYHTMRHTTTDLIERRERSDGLQSDTSSSSKPAAASKKKRSKTPADLIKPRDDLNKLMALFDKILREEYPGIKWELHNSAIARVLSSPTDIDSNIVDASCDFCGSDIFLSCFECKSCGSGASEQGCMVCPGCYVEGRTCKCDSMQPMFCRSYGELITERNKAARAVNSIATRSIEKPVEISPK